MKHGQPSIRRRLHGIMFKLPMMISCREFEDFIVDYLDGELPSSQMRIFNLHLKVCRECRDYLKSYVAARDLAKRALDEDAAQSLVDVPDDLVSAILDARGEGSPS
ncbi:MAG: zf-HC2 domain-containing protein [Stappiaceae bacterium]